MQPQRRLPHPSPTALEPAPPRAVIDAVHPEIDGGRFPIKRTVGEPVVVRAVITADGHDSLSCWLLYRRQGEEWARVPMAALGNDRWQGSFTVTELGRYAYTVEAAVHPFLTWQRDLEKRLAAGQDVAVDLQIGADILADLAERANGADEARLRAAAAALRDLAPALQDAEPRRDHQEAPPSPERPGAGRGAAALADVLQWALDPDLAALAAEHLPPHTIARHSRELEVVVDPPRARFSTWYELFPRSAAAGAPSGAEDRPRSGTFADLEALLPYVAEMGFDVLYLPPIHPIGATHRKGRNGAPRAGPGDPGSPWAIGSAAGGHTSIHPELGALEDFRRLVARAQEMGIEVALDIAFHCSPDHPWVREHPEWFRIRPDGTVQYAENPPKKYEDIYPFDFSTPHWRELWDALRAVFIFWIDQGVRTFRVDNPHTKPFAFWEWLIRDLKAHYPDLVLLSEAFTRPAAMYRLAKLGFTQSYTYFAWRNTKQELIDYFQELTQTDVREFFRPNLWPNTPDILTAYLQTGGRPAFMARLVLAATLGANYGIYGPAFELGERAPREPGSEEYLNSEKYEIKRWDLDAPHSLREFIGRVNRIRRLQSALQSDWSLQFHGIDNDQLIGYSKRAEKSVVLTVVCLDPVHRQSGWTELDLAALGVDPSLPFEVHDLLTDARYQWSGPRNYVELDPASVPAHIFAVRQPLASTP